MQMNYITDRLQLCILSSRDADKVLSFYNKNKEHFEPWEPARDPNFYSLAYHRLTLSVEYNLIQQSKALRFWLFRKQDPTEIIGSINFYNISYGSYLTCQLGYKLDANYTGNGYAYEGIQTGLQIIFDQYKLHRVEANIMPSNLASIHLIKRLGFQYEGMASSCIRINHIWEDHLKFALINE